LAGLGGEDELVRIDVGLKERKGQGQRGQRNAAENSRAQRVVAKTPDQVAGVDETGGELVAGEGGGRGQRVGKGRGAGVVSRAGLIEPPRSGLY
jgi:hypothetical protein